MQADRYLDKRKSDPKLPIDDKWDDPVKSLLNYPDVVKKMSNDLDWTSALGEAVVADQGAVIEAVQVFRRKAKAAGNLKTDDKQVVKTQQEVIIIEPADPQVIYVPQYNPIHGCGLQRGAGVRLLPGAVSVVLLPVCAGGRLGGRGRLGRRDRRGVERQSLRLRRRRSQHQRQQHHQRQSRRQHGNTSGQHGQRGSGQGGGSAVEVEQAAGAGQQFGRQAVAVQSCG